MKQFIDNGDYIQTVIDVFESDGVTYIGSPVHYAHRLDPKFSDLQSGILLKHGYYCKRTGNVGVVNVWPEYDEFELDYGVPVAMNGLLVVAGSTEHGNMREYKDLVKLSEVIVVINKPTKIPAKDVTMYWL